MNKKFFLIILIILAATSAYIFRDEIKNIVSTSTKESAEQKAEISTESLMAAISKLIILPKGETPTIATVIDPSQLKDQPFFVNAQKGDKLFIFSNSKEAILYNPSENRIVKVAPITIDQSGIEQPTTDNTTTSIQMTTTTKEKATTTPSRKKTK